MGKWRTFVDYEAEIIDEKTGEIKWMIIGEGRAKKEYRIDKKQKTIITEYERKCKRIIYKCYRQGKQTELF